MRPFLILAFGGLMCSISVADTIAYGTYNSTLECNGAAGCTQGPSFKQVNIGGLTLTYNPIFSLFGTTPGTIDLGSIVVSGTGINVNVTGIVLSIVVDSTLYYAPNSGAPLSEGTLPNGVLSGTLSTDSSAASVLFSPNNTTTISFGTLPGAVVLGGGATATYQILNASPILQAPGTGSPAGQTSITGGATSAPEPSTLVVTAAGLGLVGLLRRGRSI